MAVLTVEALHKRYGDTVAVDDVSFTVEEGEIFGLLGPNGAGKTTTVECLEGLRTPDAGRVSVLGLDPHRDRTELRQVLGAQLQDSRLPDKLRVREALRLYRSFYPDGADPDRLLADLGLADKRDAFFEDLSGGQQQRLSIALALIGNPRVAVLDELTTGLDPRARRDTWALIEQVRSTGVTILLVTHFMDEAERLCDRLAVLDRGRVVALDTPGALIAGAVDRQRVRFRVAPSFDGAVLAGLPEVSEVDTRGSEVTVTGRGDLLYAVTAALVRSEVVPADLRVEQPTLEDAFVALTAADRAPEREEVRP